MMKTKALASLGLIVVTLTSCGGSHKISEEEAISIAQQIAIHDVTDDIEKIERLTYIVSSSTASSSIKLVDRFDFVNNYYYRETVDLPSGIKKEWCYKKDNKYYNVIQERSGDQYNEVTEAFLKAKFEFIKEKIKVDVQLTNSQLVKYITVKIYDDRKDEYYSEGEGSLKMFQKSEAGKYAYELSIVDYLPRYSTTTYDGDTYHSEMDTTKCELAYPVIPS